MSPRKKKQRSVLVTGISGRFGRRLTRRLHRDLPVVGIDRRPFPDAPRDVTMYRVDLRSRRSEEAFRQHDIETVIHLNIMHDPRQGSGTAHSFNVMGARKVLECCVRYGVQKLVVLSTANLYGSSARSQEYLLEDAPLLGARDPSTSALVELDMLCTNFMWKHPEVETVVLRPSHIVGKVRNAPSNYLRLPRVPKLMGFDPLMQIIHEDDVVAAVLATLMPGARGVFNVSGPPAVPLSKGLEILNKPVVELPHLLLQPLAARMFKAGLWRFPPSELRFLQFGSTIDDTRIRNELGFTTRRSLEDSLRQFRGIL